MNIRFNIIVLLIANSQTFCNNTRQTLKAKTVPLDNIIYEVNLTRLIDSVGFYHGKTVQTSGLYFLGFESSVIVPAAPMFDSNTNQFTFKIKSNPGLWVEPKLNMSIAELPEKFISTKYQKVLITIQGVIDSSNKGHMWGSAGAILVARFIEKN